MTDRKRLQDKLTKLAGEESTINDGWRQLGDPSRDQLLAIATEIDETLYPVKISLRNTTGEVVGLAVGHRRLRCVLGDLPEPLRKFDAVCDVILADPSSDIFSQVSDMLRRHASDAEPLWVRTAELPDPDRYTAGGIPAAVLADVWSRTASDDAGAFDQFVVELKSKSSNWVKMTGRQVMESSGGASLISGGPDEVFDVAAVMSNRDPRQDQGGATLTIRSAYGAWCLAIARRKDATLVAEISERLAKSLPALWRSAGL